MSSSANNPPYVDEGLQLASSIYPNRNGEGLEVSVQQEESFSSRKAYNSLASHSTERFPARLPIKGELFRSFEPRSRPKSVTNLQRRRQCCGLTTTSLLLIALILALIAAVAAVGALLGSKAHSTSHLPTPTFTVGPNSSISAPSCPTSTNAPPSIAECENGSIYVSATQSTYSLICDTDIGAVKGTYWTLNPVHSLRQCIDACAVAPLEAGRFNSDFNCIAVTWAFDGRKANQCWLKNQTNNQESNATYLHSAVLVQT